MFINYEHENNVYSVTIERRNNYFYVTYDNSEYKINCEEVNPGHLIIKLGDRIIKSIVTEGAQEKYVFIDGNVYKVKPIELTGRVKQKKKYAGENDLNSPISGKVVSIKVKIDETVEKGTVLLVIEAMKMEYLIRAPYNGTVKKIHFKENDQIEIGQLTIELLKK